MSQLNNPFNALMLLSGRDMQIERIGEIAPFAIKAALSNYFRNFQAPAEVIIEGREIVISYTSLEGSGFIPPKRNDRLIDPVLGEMTIKEVKHMPGLMGEILGFRVRVD